MPGHHLAQLNIGRLIAPRESPAGADFMDALDDINALADGASGFIWRLQDASGNATGITLTDDPRFIVNLSVWRSIDELHAYVYRSDHNPYIGRRLAWFERHGHGL
mgnify:CR=1 FL=1